MPLTHLAQREIYPHHNDEVADYYRSSWLDYFLLWTNSDHQALHFGYQNGGSLSPLGIPRHCQQSVGRSARRTRVGCRLRTLGGSSFWLATMMRDHVDPFNRNGRKAAC